MIWNTRLNVSKSGATNEVKPKWHYAKSPVRSCSILSVGLLLVGGRLSAHAELLRVCTRGIGVPRGARRGGWLALCRLCAVTLGTAGYDPVPESPAR